MCVKPSSGQTPAPRAFSLHARTRDLPGAEADAKRAPASAPGRVLWSSTSKLLLCIDFSTFARDETELFSPLAGVRLKSVFPRASWRGRTRPEIMISWFRYWRSRNAVLTISVLCFLFPAQLCHAQQDAVVEKAHRAKEAMDEGRFEEAIDLYEHLVRELPQEPRMRLNLALALHSAGRYREATEQLRAFLKQQPESSPASLLLGLDYMKLDQPDQAVKPLEYAVRAEPNNKQARLELVQAFLALDRPEEAETHLQTLIQLEPNYPEAWQALGLTYNALSTRAFAQLERLAPESAYRDVLLARSLVEQNRILQGFNLYKQALAKDPELPAVYEGIADVYRRTEHPDWATKEKEREDALPPSNCATHKLQCEFRAGHYAQLVELAKTTKTPESYYWQACAYTELSLEAFDRLNQMPPSAAIHDLMAEAYRILGKYDLSIKELREALELVPDDRGQKEGLARALWLNRDYKEAQPLLEELVKQEPESAQLNYELGDTILWSGTAENAIPYLENAIKYSPENKAAHDSLGRAYMRAGQTEKAIPQFKAALGLDKEGTIYYQLAQAYRETGQKELAMQTMQEFERISKAAKARRPQEIYQITPP